MLFRWLSVLGLSFALAWSGTIDPLSGGILLALVVWNSAISLLAISNRRLPYHRAINLFLDLACSLGLYIVTGGVQGAVPWAGILVLLSASVYYELRGAMLAALAVAVTQTGADLIQANGMLDPFPTLVFAGLNLAAGLGLGLVGRGLIQRVRAIYQANLRQSREVEQKLQQAERNRLQAFYDSIETLSSSLNYRVVLESALDLCTSALGGVDGAAGNMLSAALLFGAQELQVEAARRFSPRDLRLTFPAVEGVLRAALDSPDPQCIQNPAADPELSKITLLDGYQSALVIALRRGADVYGVMLLAHADPAFFTPERVEVLEMMSHQAVIALQNARLYQVLEEEKDRIVTSQEEARRKLARDLHDGPIQSVASIAMRLEVARHLLDSQPEGVPQELAEVEDLARRTTKELRHTLFTLRPLSLENGGLQPALQAMADKMLETYRQQVRIELDPSVVDRLETNRQSVVFYLVEEAVNNARKHARAALIKVSLRYHKTDPGLAVLEVIDNGRGFDVQAVMGSYDQRGSLGMVNLQDRADLVNGLLSIDSVPGKGTRVQVLIPLDADAADRLQRGARTS